MMKKTMIIPDVHGRTFWHEPVFKHFSENADDHCEKIVFLGDYLDPYAYEDISFEAAIEQLRLIIDLKKEHPDDIVLLLGNHDLGYIFPDEVPGWCRHSVTFHELVNQLFWDNIDLFQLVSKEETDEKVFVYSHAGLHPGLYQSLDEGVETYSKPLRELTKDELYNLNTISKMRGGDDKVGSLIWADVDEFVEYYEYLDHIHEELGLEITYRYSPSNPKEVFQIFGHSQQHQDPVLNPHFACLDCRQAFTLSADGTLEAL